MRLIPCLNDERRQHKQTLGRRDGLLAAFPSLSAISRCNGFGLLARNTHVSLADTALLHGGLRRRQPVHGPLELVSAGVWPESVSGDFSPQFAAHADERSLSPRPVTATGRWWPSSPSVLRTIFTWPRLRTGRLRCRSCWPCSFCRISLTPARYGLSAGHGAPRPCRAAGASACTRSLRPSWFRR